jgi:hypothetical protein
LSRRLSLITSPSGSLGNDGVDLVGRRLPLLLPLLAH